MADATIVRGADDERLTAEAAVQGGALFQAPDGAAAIYNSLNGASASSRIALNRSGRYTMPKATGFVALAGGRAFWDYSAGNITYKKVNDRDFLVGRFSEDAASADATCVVNVNQHIPPDIDLVRDPFDSVPTGTQAVGGFGWPKDLGGAKRIELTATNEAQCIDLFSTDRFDMEANAIVEAIIRIPTNGSGAAVDFNIGIANGTHTTDFDSVGEYVAFHIDGGALDIFAQSKDGANNIAATDTTVDATAGSAVANRFEFWIDCRDPANVKLYINGVRVLSATVFRIDGAVGPFGLIAHLEKTAGTTTGIFIIERLTARFAKQ